MPMASEYEELENVVRRHLGAADPGLVSIVTAVAGLFSVIAYADRDHSAAERAAIQEQLGRIPGLDPVAVGAVQDVLDRHILPLSTKYVQRFTRTLRDEADAEMRLEVLDVLLAVAAADGTISHSEIVSLRNLTTALGLTQGDYNRLQETYRGHLHFAADSGDRA